MRILRFTRWSALSIVFVSQPRELRHLLVGVALDVEAKRVALQRREAGPKTEDEALELLRRDDADGRVVDAGPGQCIAERALPLLLAGGGLAERDV